MSAPAVIELHGITYSTCTKRVKSVLAFHDLAYEFKPIDFAKGEHKAPAFLALQPFGQVPALKHGDFVVFESRAIARYLDNIATSGKHLVPKDVKKAALVEQWLSVDHDNIQPNLKGVVAEKYHWYGPNENAEAIKAAQVKLENVFNVLDAHFAKNQWFIGDEVTLADLSPLAYIELYYLLGGEYAAAIDSRPNLSSWWKRARALPAWQAASPSQN